MNGRRAKQLRRERHGPNLHRFNSAHDTALTWAWASTEPGAVDEAKQATHDRLIAQLGARRRSGVAWDVLEGEAAKAQLRHLHSHSDQWRQGMAKLREFGGFLVVAMANADKR